MKETRQKEKELIDASTSEIVYIGDLTLLQLGIKIENVNP